MPKRSTDDAINKPSRDGDKMITFAEFIEKPELMLISSIVASNVKDQKTSAEIIVHHVYYLYDGHRDWYVIPNNLPRGEDGVPEGRIYSHGVKGNETSLKAHCPVYRSKDKHETHEDLHLKFHEALYKRRAQLLYEQRKRIGFMTPKLPKDKEKREALEKDDIAMEKYIKKAFRKCVGDSVWYPVNKVENDETGEIESVLDESRPHTSFGIFNFPASHRASYQNTKFYQARKPTDTKDIMYCIDDFVSDGKSAQNVKSFSFFPCLTVAEFYKSGKNGIEITPQIKIKESDVWKDQSGGPSRRLLHAVQLPVEILSECDTPSVSPTKDKSKNSSDSQTSNSTTSSPKRERKKDKDATDSVFSSPKGKGKKDQEDDRITTISSLRDKLGKRSQEDSD